MYHKYLTALFVKARQFFNSEQCFSNPGKDRTLANGGRTRRYQAKMTYISRQPPLLWNGFFVWYTNQCSDLRELL